MLQKHGTVCQADPLPVRQEYKMDLKQFTEAMKLGIVPKFSDINYLYNLIKTSEYREYITFTELRNFYQKFCPNYDTDELYRKMQDHGTQCEAEPGPVRKIYKMDIGQFRKVVNLGLVPRCAGLYDVFRGIIGGDRRDYLYLSDMIAHYGTDYDHNIFSLDHIIKKYGVPKGNGQRLYFDGFSKAMSLNYLPKPRILQHQR
ncbi:uncharacterized protein LOC126834452 isoform X3 [Adelges cooleyi]|nr:uncharacterized protein LOC126834452 isoform X3 [Adelges cooleyi]